MHRPRDSKGRYIKIRNIIETKTPTTKLLTLEVQRRDSSLGKISRQAQSSQSIKLGKESQGWTKEFSVLWEEEMDPNNTNNEELRDRLEREAREAVENARIEGEMLRREAERKAKEDEDRGSNNENDEELTFGFPICDIPTAFGREVRMKNIPPSILPNFYGTSTEDPDSFLFEFDVLCRTYGYTDDTQKLRLFPTTLKGAALKWFMGLGVNTILYWIDMKKIFLKKYQPYCRTRDSKDDIFRMTQHEEENLEDYLERFLYNLQKSKQSSLNSDTIRTIFLKGVRDDYINVLNLMGVGDISFLPFDQISELCRKYSRGKAKTGKDSRDSLSKVSKSTSESVTRVELGNLL